MFVKIGEGAGSLLRGGIASGESSGIPATRFGDDSMECDNCQGNGTKFRAFELRRNKGSGWKGLAGIGSLVRRKPKAGYGCWLALRCGWRGRPPRAPFRREAARFGRLLERPPSWPSLAAIHFLEPKKPSKSAGR